jgi:hypothetical protein
MNNIMNNNMYEFGGDTPALEGTTWWRPDGGDHFTVRDVLMGPEGFTIHTTDGRMISGEVMETYIQSNEPISIPKQAPAQHITTEELTAGIDEADAAGVIQEPGQDVLHKTFGSLKYDHSNIQQPTQQEIPTDNIDMTMIKRVLDNIDIKDPDVTISVTSDLQSAISTLINILNVDMEALVKYFKDRLYSRIAASIECSIIDLCGTTPKASPGADATSPDDIPDKKSVKPQPKSKKK